MGYSQAYISNIETGKMEPSREFLKKLNEIFAVSSDFVLYGEDIKIQGLEHYASRSIMPWKFIQRLRMDLNLIKNTEDFYSSLDIPKEIIEGVLGGKLYLTRNSVIKMAQKLNQPVHEYLLLAHYIPEEFEKFSNQPEIINIFKQLAELPSNDIREVVNIILTVIKPYLKNKKLES